MKAACFESGDFESNKVWRCFHSGDLGDIIYSLLFCKSLGKVDLLIGRTRKYQVREQMSTDKFRWLLPLLQVQPYIRSALLTPQDPKCDYDLNEFRKIWLKPNDGLAKGRMLWQAYFDYFGKPLEDARQSWIQVDPHTDTEHPVVINRTNRFQNHAFDWRKIARDYSGSMLFVGLKSEYEAWKAEFGNHSIYYPTANAKVMASAIAGCHLFIGNQSFPMALALALNVPVVQESWPNGADCIIQNKSQAQFILNQKPQNLPNIPRTTERLIVPSIGRSGTIELGPMAGGAGIGDTLMIQPLARALGKKATMFLPERLSRLAFLFRNACPVRINNNHPVYHYTPKVLQTYALLRQFGFADFDPVPTIEVNPERINEAKALLDGKPNPIAFCPTCSRHWSHCRQRPYNFWKPVVSQLVKRYTVLQFGFDDYPLLDGAVRMPFVELETLASLYKLIQNYVGVNTGDYHLMIAVGGRVVVADQDPWTEQEAWSYNIPKRAQYGKLSHPGTVLAAMERLGI